jgi:nitrate/TMAO reductase-like tetraheme cytochrome c subunit
MQNNMLNEIRIAIGAIIQSRVAKGYVMWDNIGGLNHLTHEQKVKVCQEALTIVQEYDKIFI